MPISNPAGPGTNPRTRKFLVPVGMAWNDTDGTPIYVNANGRVELPDAKLSVVCSGFTVPEDFVSSLTVKAVVVPENSGDVYIQTAIGYAQCGEDWTTHSASVGYSAIACTTPNFECILSVALANAAVGDIVWIVTKRDAVDVLDTINGTTVYIGWLVEYTADM